MTKYNVHIYREMRLVYLDIEAASPEEAARTCAEFPADEACSEAVDCDADTFAALVDVQGDLDYTQSQMIDFEAGRMQKAATELLEALTGLVAAVGGLPITILRGPFYEALHRAKSAISKARGE